MRANRFGVGARIRVRVRTAEGRRTIHAVAGGGGSFGGGSLQAEIGLGAATAIEAVTIAWPRPGPPQELTGLELDSFYLVREDGTARKLSPPRFVVGGDGHAAGRHGG